MSITAGEGITVLEQRLHADGVIDIAFSETFMLDLLTKCQRVINAALRRVVVYETLPTVAFQIVYTYRTTTGTGIDIISVNEVDATAPNSKGREIKRVEFDQLPVYDIDWPASSGTRFEAWAQVGKNLLVLYPRTTSTAGVRLTMSKLTNELTTTSTLFEMPDEDIEFVYDLAEVCMLTRSRLHILAKEKMELLTTRIAQYVGGTNE